MNKNIEKFKEQLDPVAIIGNWGRIEWCDNVYPQMGDRMYAAIDIENFAYMIIQECALIADIEIDYSAGCGYVTQTIGQRINKHFGVKE